MVLALSFVAHPSLAQGPATVEDPKSLDEFFRVDPATGRLMPLEVIRIKNDGTYRSGFSTYLVGGPASTVSFPSDEPQVFAIRRLQPPEKQLNGQHPQIEPLALQKGRRYATSTVIQMNAELHGEPAYGLDKDQKKNRPAYLYLFWPKENLPPGEYALTWNGAFYGEAIAFTKPRVAGGAFRIVETRRAPAPAVAPPSAASAAPAAVPTVAAPAVAAPTAAAPAISAADIERLRRAADQGDVQSQFSLARAYANGTGVPQSYDQTALWLGKAADSGSADAQYWLAVMYRDAMGVPPDATQMVQLFRKAAEQGHAQAQANLGHLYFFGRGVTQDYLEAYTWLNIATARLNSDERQQTAELRDKVAGLLTPVQLKEAQARAVDWTEAFQKSRPQ
jgi:hypothetical protein